jgi:hypothetical protein
MRETLPARAASMARAMTTPQDPLRRRKQKARRSKQLAAWRERQANSAPKSERKGDKK